MSQSIQLRVAAGLNLIAACVGAVFFVLDLFRLFTRHPSGSLLFRDLAFLVFFGLGAYVFWGRYRALSAQTSRSGPSS